MYFLIKRNLENNHCYVATDGCKDRVFHSLDEARHVEETTRRSFYGNRDIHIVELKSSREAHQYCFLRNDGVPQDEALAFIELKRR